MDSESYRASFVHMKYNFFKRHALKLHGSLQTNKDYKGKLEDVLCFPNMTSAVDHTVILIPDYLHSTFHIFVFLNVLLQVLTCTSNSKNVLFIQNRFIIIINSKCEIYKIQKTQTKFCNFYKKMFKRTWAIFLCFQHYNRYLKSSSYQTSFRRLGR